MLGEIASQSAVARGSWQPRTAAHRKGHSGIGGGGTSTAWRAAAQAQEALAVVAWPRRTRPRPSLESILQEVRPGAYLPLPQADLGMDHPTGTPPGAGRPLELADPGGLRAAASGASLRCGPEAALGEALRPWPADSV